MKPTQVNLPASPPQAPFPASPPRTITSVPGSGSGSVSTPATASGTTQSGLPRAEDVQALATEITNDFDDFLQKALKKFQDDINSIKF